MPTRLRFITMMAISSPEARHFSSELDEVGLCQPEGVLQERAESTHSVIIFQWMG